MGGRTILCDGWKVASALKANHPELYFLLSSVPIPRSFCKHQHSVHRTLKMNMKSNFWDKGGVIGPANPKMQALPGWGGGSDPCLDFFEGFVHMH